MHNTVQEEKDLLFRPQLLESITDMTRHSFSPSPSSEDISKLKRGREIFLPLPPTAMIIALVSSLSLSFPTSPPSITLWGYRANKKYSKPNLKTWRLLAAFLLAKVNQGHQYLVETPCSLFVLLEMGEVMQ